MSARDDIEATLGTFETASLAAFEAMQPMRRSEHKFLLPEDALPDLLRRLSESFRLLEDFGTSSFSYRTDYFDTADFRCFSDHIADVAGRSKLRLRHYNDAGTAMLEIKRKAGNGRIIKQRAQVADGISVSELRTVPLFQDAAAELGAAPESCLSTMYTRSSLLSIDRSLRITVDRELSSIAPNGRSAAFPGLVVLEVKAGEHSSGLAGLRSLIRASGGLRTPFSKYVAGMAGCYPGLRSGLLKPRAEALRKLYIQPIYNDHSTDSIGGID